MLVHQIRLGFDDTRTLMKELDRDGDGRVNYREFVRFLRGGSDGSKAAADIDRPIRGGDSSKSGVGSASTSASLKVSERVAGELRTKFDAAIDSGKIKSYEDVFRAMDKDGDGHVSRSEFEDGLRDLRVRLCWQCVCECDYDVICAYVHVHVIVM